MRLVVCFIALTVFVSCEDVCNCEFPETFAIQYEGVSGAENDNPVSYTIDDGSISLKPPVLSGRIFAGWFTDVSFTQAATIPAIPEGSTGNKTFYAKWQNP